MIARASGDRVCTSTRPAPPSPRPARPASCVIERERPLLGTEVREAQRLVGVDHDAERHIPEVVTLGDHLRADQHAGRRAA